MIQKWKYFEVCSTPGKLSPELLESGWVVGSLGGDRYIEHLTVLMKSKYCFILVVIRDERYYRSDFVSRILALFGKYRISVISRHYRDILYDILNG